MRAISLKKWLPVFATLVAVSGQAQPPPKAASAAAPPKQAQLSVADMTDRVMALSAQVQDDLAHVQHLQRLSRKEKDLIKLACVNDQLVEMKAQVNIFDSTKVQFQSSANQGVDAARSVYNDLVNDGENIKKTRGNADGCIGVPELYKQESGNDAQHPIFPDDPTLPPDHTNGSEPPGYASPFV